MIKDQTNFFSGVLFLAVGLGVVVASLGYQIGTPARMGSGFFPLCLGIILLGLGAALAFQSCTAGAIRDRLETWELKPLLIILGSVTLFGVLLLDFGLIVATIAMVVASSFASREGSWTTVFATSVFLALFCYLIFVVGLELQVPVLPSLS